MVSKMRREDVSQGKMKNKNMEDRIMFISTYDKHYKLIKKEIVKAWHVLRSDAKYDRLFHDNPRFIYHNSRMIGNSLVNSDIDIKNIE